MKKAAIFWCTGLSGSGKTTLSLSVEKIIQRYGLKTCIIDGDTIRDKYPKKLGFGRSDIRKNNLNISELCKKHRFDYDVIIVPIISPIDTIRQEVRKILSPGFFLVYMSADIGALKRRDVKGLYAKADSGEIDNLIGYSDINPYDIPEDYDLKINTSNYSEIASSCDQFAQFILKRVV